MNFQRGINPKSALGIGIWRDMVLVKASFFNIKNSEKPLKEEGWYFPYTSISISINDFSLDEYITKYIETKINDFVEQIKVRYSQHVNNSSILLEFLTEEGRSNSETRKKLLDSLQSFQKHF